MGDILAGICVLLGGVFAVISGLGLVRMQDVLMRMHASTKAGTLGSALAMAGAALHFWDSGVTVRSIATVVFLMLTAPIAAHMIGRAAFRLQKRPGRDPMD